MSIIEVRYKLKPRDAYNCYPIPPEIDKTTLQWYLKGLDTIPPVEEGWQSVFVPNINESVENLNHLNELYIVIARGAQGIKILGMSVLKARADICAEVLVSRPRPNTRDLECIDVCTVKRANKSKEFMEQLEKPNTMFILFKTVSSKVKLGVDISTNVLGVFDTIDLAKATAEKDAVEMGFKELALQWNDDNKAIVRALAAQVEFDVIEATLNEVLPEGGINVAYSTLNRGLYGPIYKV